MERRIPEGLRPTSECQWGVTQFRFACHALQGVSDLDGTFDALIRDRDGKLLPVLVPPDKQSLIAFPGADASPLPADYNPDDRYERIEGLPGADIPAFQWLLESASTDPEFREWFHGIHNEVVPDTRPDASWFSGGRSLPAIRRAFEWFYGSDEALGVSYDPDLEVSVLPNGDDFGKCTNSAHLMGRVFGGSVTGFLVRDNPEVTHDVVIDPGGHDYLVVNDRYVVDLWVSVYCHGTTEDGRRLPIVYDLRSEDLSEQALVASLYGNRDNWSVLESYPAPLPEPPFTDESLGESPLQC